MYGTPEATFPDPALVFAAEALATAFFWADFASDDINRSESDGVGDVLMRESRVPKQLLPPMDNEGDGEVKRGLRPVIVLLTAVKRRGIWRAVPIIIIVFILMLEYKIIVV